MMGPRIFSVEKGETRYSIKALPFGGSCMMVGEDSENPDPKAFNNKPVLSRIAVIAAGPVFNFILAFLFAMLIVAQIGHDAPVLTGVMEKSPAEEAGLQAGDRITRINGRHITAYRDIMLYTFSHPGQEMKVSFTTNVISYPLNVFLDFCLIFGNFGMPELGIRGAAVGTVIARVVELLILCRFLFRKEKKLSMKFSDLKRRDRRLLGDFWKVGLPIVFHELIWSTGTTAGSSITGQMGTTIVAGYNIANVYYQLMACVTNAILYSCSTTIGKTIGSGASKDRIQKEAYSMVLIGLVSGTLMGLLTLMFGGLFTRLYVLTPDAAAYARNFMLVFAAIWPFSGMEMTGMIAVLRAGGDGKMGLICDIFSMWMITIPLAAACAFVFRLSPYLVVSIIKFNIAIEAFVGIWRIHTKKWMRNLTR